MEGVGIASICAAFHVFLPASVASVVFSSQSDSSLAANMEILVDNQFLILVFVSLNCLFVCVCVCLCDRA
jgi:hypothetical protein